MTAKLSGIQQLAMVFCFSLLSPSLNAQELVDNLQRVVEELPSTLDTREEQNDLTVFAVAFHNARVQLAPNGYERDPAFTWSFQATFDAFVSRLKRGDFADIEIAEADMEMWQTAYEAGIPALQNLLDHADERGHWLAELGWDYIEENQMRYCALVYSEDRDVWLQGLEWSQCVPITLGR
jgi:hypothetical protein